MGKNSKDLLRFEHKNSSTSALESSLLVCKTESQRKKTNTDEKPRTFLPLPKSQVLGKVKDFLGVISEANKRLELDAKVGTPSLDNSKSYDIEALTGDESEVIEMDLMLGIADLHTPEAVAAAESAISGYQPVIPLADSSSESESGEDESDNDVKDEDNEAAELFEKKLPSPKQKRSSKSDKGNSLSEVGNGKLKKRPKIVEL